jgi:hypothetical protein
MFRAHGPLDITALARYLGNSVGECRELLDGPLAGEIGERLVKTRTKPKRVYFLLDDRRVEDLEPAELVRYRAAETLEAFQRHAARLVRARRDGKGPNPYRGPMAIDLQATDLG